MQPTTPQPSAHLPPLWLESGFLGLMLCQAGPRATNQTLSEPLDGGPGEALWARWPPEVPRKSSQTQRCRYRAAGSRLRNSVGEVWGVGRAQAACTTQTQKQTLSPHLHGHPSAQTPSISCLGHCNNLSLVSWLPAFPPPPVFSFGTIVGVMHFSNIIQNTLFLCSKSSSGDFRQRKPTGLQWPTRPSMVWWPSPTPCPLPPWPISCQSPPSLGSGHTGCLAVHQICLTPPLEDLHSGHLLCINPPSPLLPRIFAQIAPSQWELVSFLKSQTANPPAPRDCSFPPHYALLFPTAPVTSSILYNSLTYYFLPLIISTGVSAPQRQGFSQTPVCLAHNLCFIIHNVSGNIWKPLLLENFAKEEMVEGSWERVPLSLLIRLAFGKSGCSTVKDNWYIPLHCPRVHLQIVVLVCPDYDSRGLFHKLKEGLFFSPSRGKSKNHEEIYLSQGILCCSQSHHR